ncbi:MAG: PstS family phosphate ABC transporter substrate-binding protein [Desulfomonilaceae bacterium]
MKKPLLITLTLALCLVSFLTLVSAQAPSAKTVIRVKGSDDMASRIDKMAKLYTKDNPQINVIVSGSSMGAGFPDLFDKTCEVVMTGHDLTSEDKQAARGKGIDLTERLVGYGAVVILTYPQNTLDELTVEQVQKLFKGDYTVWKQVGGADHPVVVVSVENLGSDTRMFLMHDFLNVPSVRASVERVTSFRGVAKKVAETLGSLGFSRLRDIEGGEGEAGAKILKIKMAADSPGVLPSRSSIADQSYPVRRPFYLCFDSRANDEVKRFVEFIVSKGWGAQ